MIVAPHKIEGVGERGGGGGGGKKKKRKKEGHGMGEVGGEIKLIEKKMELRTERAKAESERGRE